MNTLLGKTNKPSLPSVNDFQQLPRIFSDFFKNKILSIRNSFLCVAVYWHRKKKKKKKKQQQKTTTTDCQLTFSGTPVLSFTPVSEQFVEKIILQTVPKTSLLGPIRRLNFSTKRLKFFSRQSPTFSTNHSHQALFPLNSKQQSPAY